MPQVKIESTPKHRKAIKNAIDAYGSRAELSEFMKVKQVMISQWLHGKSVIPLKHAEFLASNKKIPIAFLDLRPDFKKYKKYFD